MGALDLSRRYYFDVAKPLLEQEFPHLYPRLAIGLVGNGSECLGFDDELSADHDWGVDFFLWTAEADRDAIPKLQEWRACESCPPNTRYDRRSIYAEEYPDYRW
jgi:hypothetical protein